MDISDFTGSFLFTQSTFIYIALIFGLVFITFTPYLTRKLFRALLAIVLLTPLSVDYTLPGGIKLSTPAELLIIVVALVLTAKILAGMDVKKNTVGHPISLLLIGSLVWALLTTLTSEIPMVSLKRFLIETLYTLVLFFGFLWLKPSRKTNPTIWLLYGVGLVIPILISTYNHYTLGFGQKASVYVSYPFFDEHTIYAASVTFVIPFFAIRLFSGNSNKLFNAGMLIVLLTAFITAYSRAAWISLLLSGIFFLMMKMRMSMTLILFSAMAVIIAGLWNFRAIENYMTSSNTRYSDEITEHFASVTNLQNDASNLERINRWKSAWEMFLDKPITGYGPGTYQFVYDKFQYPQNMTRISTHFGDRGNAHSEYLMLLSERGFIGLTLFLCIILWSIRISLKLLYNDSSKKEKVLIYSAILGLTTFFIHGLFNSFIDSSKMAVLYYGSLSVLVYLDIKRISKSVVNFQFKLSNCRVNNNI